jgi:hypothetical protein
MGYNFSGNSKWCINCKLNTCLLLYFLPNPLGVAAALEFFLLGSSSSLLEPADLIAAAFFAAAGFLPLERNLSSFSCLESFQDVKDKYATCKLLWKLFA